MRNVTVLNHPFVQDALTKLRDKTTTTQAFRTNAEKISTLLITEASRNLSLNKKDILTPLQEMAGEVLDTQVVIATIFRAGLAMLEPAIKLFPDAPIGFIGLARDENTAIAKEYYWKLPELTKESTVLLLDPMLATGGSLLHVLKKVKRVREVILITVISAPEGIAAIHDSYPDVKIITGAVDERLNDKKFIVPGLGDFGDRYFGTDAE